MSNRFVSLNCGEKRNILEFTARNPAVGKGKIVLERTYSTSVLFRRFLPYLFRYKSILFIDLFCAALTTSTELVLPMLLRQLTNAGLGGSGALTAQLVFQLAGLYFILRVIEIIASYYMANVGHVMGARIETDMRRDAFNHLTELSVSFFNETKVGQVMARITSDLFDVTEFAHHCPEEFFIGFLKATIAFIVLLQINVPLTLMIFAMIPLMLLAVRHSNKKMRGAFKEQRHHIGELNADLEDTLLGVRVVKSFAAEEYERENFEHGNQRFFSIKQKAYRYMAAFHTTTGIFDGLMYLIVILGGGLFLLNGSIGAGDLVAYMLYVTTLLATVRRVVQFMEQFQRGMTGIERFFEIVDTDIEIFDDPEAVPLENVKGEVRFENVRFSYADAEPVLNGLSFTIPAGGQIALVGPSGGGKTTVCNLIPRFYDVDDGSIRIDGIDVRRIQLKSLRENIGMVAQDVYLFSGTVLDNIRYGTPHASREDCIRAAEKAGADGFIRQLPHGYDTHIGERGIKLSGGQRQRLSIARVFLKNPPILLLDEATSALDNQSERHIQRSLDELAHGRTTLTIAHRLTTVENADCILVLTEEGLVEQGTHEQLLAKNGVYASLYRGNRQLDVSA